MRTFGQLTRMRNSKPTVGVVPDDLLDAGVVNTVAEGGHGADCEGAVAAGQQGPAEQRVPEPRPPDWGSQDETRES